MTFNAMVWALEHPDVAGTDKVVLIAIARYADEHDAAWAKLSMLVQCTCRSERAVQYSLATLEELGLLTRVLNGGGGTDWRGGRKPNLYQLQRTAPQGRSPARKMVQPTSLNGVQPTAPRIGKRKQEEQEEEPARGAGGSPPRKRRASRAAEDEWGTAIGADPDAEAERAAAVERTVTRWSDLVNSFHARAVAATPTSLKQQTNGHALMRIFKNLDAKGVTVAEIEAMVKEFFRKGSLYFDPGKDYPAWQQFGWKLDALAKVARPRVELTEEEYEQAWSTKLPEIEIDYSGYERWKK